MMKLLIMLGLVANLSYAQVTDKCNADYAAEMLKEHNRYRTLHKAPKMTTGKNLEKSAKAYAKVIAAKDVLEHSTTKFGENLVTSTEKNLKECKKIAKMHAKLWYDENKLYKYATGGFASATGHFTQMVWKNTKKIGCGLALSSSKKVYGVCQYEKAGNVIGAFQKNVLPASGAPSATTKVPSDSSTKVPSDSSTKVPSDSSTKVPSDSSTKVPVITKVPSRIPKDPSMPPKNPSMPPKNPSMPAKKPSMIPKVRGGSSKPVITMQ